MNFLIKISFPPHNAQRHMADRSSRILAILGTSPVPSFREQTDHRL